MCVRLRHRTDKVGAGVGGGPCVLGCGTAVFKVGRV